MYNVGRFLDALTPLGFFLGFEYETEAGFVRASCVPSLFEVIDVHASKLPGGRWGDISAACVLIALTPGHFTSPKGMAEVGFLADYMPTKTKAEAVVFERTVVESAPQGLADLVRLHGDRLLERTADARTAADRYMAKLDLRLTVPELIARLSDGASESEMLEARRLSRTEGFIGLPERTCYDLVSLVVTRHAADVEGDARKFWGKSPRVVPEFNWRIQLLASRLYPERGWDLLEA